jgi:putative transcriptional regulator
MLTMASFTPGKDNAPAFSAAELKALKALSPEARRKAAETDPDALPLTAEMLEHISVGQSLKLLRKKLDMTQADFAKTYRFTLARLRDLEQGRQKTADSAIEAYVRLIAMDPKGVARKLKLAKAG